MLNNRAIGDIRHVHWHLSKSANPLDLSGEYNWRTDKKIAKGGYFDDLASHGLDLISYLLGDFKQVQGLAHNQQGLYSSYDAVTANWLHVNGVTGSGSWNFSASSRQDTLTIYGSAGELSFSVFAEQPLVLTQGTNREEFFIENPENIQLYHVKNMRDQLVQGIQHPSTGDTALHTSWVMEKILQD